MEVSCTNDLLLRPRRHLADTLCNLQRHATSVPEQYPPVLPGDWDTPDWHLNRLAEFVSGHNKGGIPGSQGASFPV
jgi:hypothetical protein